MILLIVDDGADFASQLTALKEVRSDCRAVKYQELSTKEILELCPELIVLNHRMAVPQCNVLRAAADNSAVRIMAITDRESAVIALLQGADTALTAPVDDEWLRRAAANECATARRWGEARKLLTDRVVISSRFRLKAVLGVSLRATVYLADDIERDTEVTVKILRRMMLAQKRVVGEFINEANKIRAIRAPELVELSEIGLWNDLPYLVFRIGRAENLYQVLRHRKLTDAELVQLGLSMTRALLMMKHFRMLHMNLKPENVLFDGERFRLAEFGIPIPSSAPQDNFGFGYWCDSAFAAPEMFIPRSSLVARSDVYSLGLLLYVASSRRNPFSGRHSAAIADAHLSNEQPDWTKCEPPLTQSLEATLSSMTLFRAEARPRLRDLEIIFYQLLTLITGKFHKEPLGTSYFKTKSSVANGESSLEMVVHRQTDDGACTEDNVLRRVEAPVALSESDSVGSVHVRFFPEWLTWRHVVYPAAAAAILIALGWWVGRRTDVPHFHQGPAQMFTCFAGHTYRIRTLDLRNVRCPECRDFTSPSYTCRKCRERFGLSIWPLRNMTEGECEVFEKRLKKCPYCRSTEIQPTRLSGK